MDTNLPPLCPALLGPCLRAGLPSLETDLGPAVVLGSLIGPCWSMRIPPMCLVSVVPMGGPLPRVSTLISTTPPS